MPVFDAFAAKATWKCPEAGLHTDHCQPIVAPGLPAAFNGMYRRLLYTRSTHMMHIGELPMVASIGIDQQQLSAP